jgi:DNA-nicking Smr family endonuclease|eukprot:g475.t1
MGLVTSCLQLLGLQQRPAPTAGAAPNPLVDDGSELTRLRSAASEYAKKRHELLNESQAAYQRGEKKKAHGLSVEGKSWGKKMENANAECVKVIVKPQRMERCGRVDLHGLFLKEAEAVVNQFLDHHIRGRAYKQVEIITGAGHHSVHKDHPVIRPRVKTMLEDRRLNFHAEHGNGAFLVDIPGGTGHLAPQIGHPRTKL